MSEHFSLVALDKQRKFLGGGKAQTAGEVAAWAGKTLLNDVVGSISVRRVQDKAKAT